MSYTRGFRELTEEVSEVQLEVSGALPAWLGGTLYRNGPALFHAGERPLRHWFDGLAMLHRFAFAEGGVTYTNRFLRSRSYRHITEKGSVGYTDFGTMPDNSLMERLSLVFGEITFPNNANVNVLRHAGRLVAITETPGWIEIDPVTLETRDPLPWADDLRAIQTLAHPHIAANGDWLNLAMSLGRESAYHIYRLPSDSLRREVIATIPVAKPAWMHSFAVTETRIILIEHPFRASPLSFVTAQKPFIEHYQWEPEVGTRFIILEKASGEVLRTVTTEAFFCFHQINAFDDGDDIVLDVPAISSDITVQAFYRERLLDPEQVRVPGGEFRRYRIPPSSPPTYRLLFTPPIEFPIIDYERTAGRPYRYVWGVSQPDMLTRAFSDRIVKFDIETGAVRQWHQPGCYPGEPIFVARPGTTAEDDGVILTLVLDTQAELSDLVLLDAATLDEVGRARTPHAIPFGFHGAYFRQPPTRVI